MKTQLTTLDNAARTFAKTHPVSAGKPVLAVLMRLLWTAALVLPTFGAKAGVVFTSLYSFTGTNDGANPTAGLVQGSNGSFYGTTENGGATNYNAEMETYGYGTVFKITTNGALTTLYSFTGTNDGANPAAALVQGSDGNFYGTTPNGGTNGLGTVFKISANGALTSLYSFGSVQDTNGLPLDGSYPAAGLVQGSDGNFYGTTEYEGTNGYGTVFKITTNGALTTLYTFGNNAIGVLPNGLVQGSDGNFYGTTEYDGFMGPGLLHYYGNGTVFKISPTGALTTLYTFGTVSHDGAYPAAGMVEGRDGNFYGTTEYTSGEGAQWGGTSFGGAGTVFNLSPDGALTSLYSFGSVQDTNGTPLDGASPSAALVQGSDGYFYGTTFQGGTNGYGTVFRLTIVPEPQLAIIPSGPYVILTWPTDYARFSYAGYTLQSTTNLGSSAVWTSVFPGPVVIGGQNLVINTISGRQQFYRLSQ